MRWIGHPRCAAQALCLCQQSGGQDAHFWPSPSGSGFAGDLLCSGTRQASRLALGFAPRSSSRKDTPRMLRLVQRSLKALPHHHPIAHNQSTERFRSRGCEGLRRKRNGALHQRGVVSHARNIDGVGRMSLATATDWDRWEVDSMCLQSRLWALSRRSSLHKAGIQPGFTGSGWGTLNTACQA